jgi:hypothetical protein
MQTALITLLGLLAACETNVPAARPATQATTHPALAERARPVAALWHAVGYPPPDYKGPMRGLIIGVWSDGTIVWSDNRKTGGPPYLTAAVAPERVQKLLTDLADAGFFDETYENYYPPDASHTVLAADSGTRRKRLATWMDLVRPATAAGDKPEPRPHEAHFEQVWTPSRRLIEQVVPSKGQPVETIDEAIFIRPVRSSLKATSRASSPVPGPKSAPSPPPSR